MKPLVSPEITDLTICRAIFAAWVFAYHVDLHANFTLGPVAALLHRGYLGVDGFFVLSGIILARVHDEFRTTLWSAPRFWGKRLARIYPVHLAIIVILGILVAAGHVADVQANDPMRFTLLSLVQNLLLAQGWGFGPHWSWNYPSWSISTEWAGYVIFPLLTFILFRMPVVVMGQLTIVCFPTLGVLAVWSHQGLNLTYTDALPRFFIEFFWGICTARLVPAFADFLPTGALTAVGAGIVIAGTLIGYDTFAFVGLWLLIASLTMHADREQPPLLTWLKFLRPLGLISYSFYMSFATAELLMAQVFRHAGLDPASSKFLYAAGMTALTTILAVLLNRLVETPCRRAADRWLTPKPPPEIIPPPQRLGRIKPVKVRAK